MSMSRRTMVVVAVFLLAVPARAWAPAVTPTRPVLCTARTVPSAAAAADVGQIEEWVCDTFDRVDYAALLHNEDDASLADDTSDELLYGESDLAFFLKTLRTALALGGGDGSAPGGGFVDIGAGRGQLVLVAAKTEPDALPGPCVGLELLPELHAIAQGAQQVAATDDPMLSRVDFVRGNMNDAGTLRRICRGARVVFLYASKFTTVPSPVDGTPRLAVSASLAEAVAGGLAGTAGPVVVTINKELCPSHGWTAIAPPISGATPCETADVGWAYFWRLGGPQKSSP